MARLFLLLALSCTLVACKTTRTATSGITQKKSGFEGRLLDTNPEKQFDLGGDRSFNGFSKSLSQKKFIGSENGYDKKSFAGSKDFMKPAYTPKAFEKSNFYQARDQANLPDDIAHTASREASQTFRDRGNSFRDGKKILPTSANYSAAKGQENATRPKVVNRPNSVDLTESQVQDLLNKGKNSKTP